MVIIYLNLFIQFICTLQQHKRQFKYNGKCKSVSPELFEKRKDKVRYEFFAQKFHSDKTAGQWALANCVYNSNDWFYHSFEETKEIYDKWKGIHEALKRTIESDLNKLVKAAKGKYSIEKFLQKTPSGKKPPLLQALLQGMVTKETVVVINRVHPFLSNWINDYDYDPLISDELFIIQKYDPFIIVSDELIEKSLISWINQVHV